MKPKFKNIKDAMLSKRGSDKIVAILNNRFCLSYTEYTDGTFSKDIAIHFLYNKSVRHTDVVYWLGSLQCFKRALRLELERKRFFITGFGRNYVDDVKAHIIDYRKSKQRFRQLDRALKAYIENKKENYEIIEKVLASSK